MFIEFKKLIKKIIQLNGYARVSRLCLSGRGELSFVPQRGTSNVAKALMDKSDGHGRTPTSTLVPQYFANLERDTGIGPAPSPWEGDVLPLY